MKRLYGPKYDINTKLDLIKIGLQNKDSTRTTKKPELLKSFKNAEVYKPFLIIVLLGVVQQFSGMTILRAYVVKIFNGIFQALENESIDSFDKKTLDERANDCNHAANEMSKNSIVVKQGSC